jgi:hypothetical protein|tara:strand:- start:297 stop:872 length:576 start_codon:yes stop_codon:yes gene_type:complete
MGFFSYSGTFTELGGDFDGKASVKTVGKTIEIKIGKDKYVLPQDLKPGTYSFENRVVQKQSAGKTLLRGLGALSALKGRSVGNPFDIETTSESKETTVNLQFKDTNIFSGVMKTSDFSKFHQELGVVDFSNYKKAHQKRVSELEKFLTNIKQKFSSMDGSEQKDATKHIKSTKDRINSLEKEFNAIEKKVK